MNEEVNRNYAPKKPELCLAIQQRRKITFLYNGKLRKGNPQCYGINKRGNEALRVHLLQGGRPEQMFLCDDVRFTITDEFFEKAGPNYHKGDKDMDYIFCELEE